MENRTVERLRKEKKDDGPWFVLKCSECGIIDHGSARPELEQEAMKHKDEKTAGVATHTVETEKIVERDVTHEIKGVADETRVECGLFSTSFGPHPDAKDEFDYCPYCGENVEDGDHRQDLVEGGVFCVNTVMSTYRYCPGCGAKAK